MDLDTNGTLCDEPLGLWNKETKAERNARDHATKEKKQKEVEKRRAYCLSRLPDLAYISEHSYTYTKTGSFHVLMVHQRNRNEKLAFKCFPWENYEGGKEEALHWARDWRDDIYIELLEKGIYQEFISLQPTRMYVQKNNTTGTSGVQHISYVQYSKNAKGEKVPYKAYAFAATWTEYQEDAFGKITRHPMKKSFGIKKYGYDQAYESAVEYRKKKEKYLQSPEHMKIRDRRAKSTRKSYGTKQQPNKKRPCTKK
ncbi:MAG: hypothetical protein JEZ12_13180 [Desulfobacterium sp.]|nr:hypothetical protein [Desulfobacterium sp.]